MTLDYFPQYYLFYAYVKLKQYDNAKPFAAAAKPPKPVVADAQTVLAEYQKETAGAQALAAAMPKFETAVTKADAALRDKKFDEAIAAYNEANGILPDEFKKRGGDTKLADARTGKAAADKAAEDARTKAADDVRTKAANDVRTAALNEFNGIVGRANQALAAKNYPVAIAALNEAKNKSAIDFNNQGLQPKLDQALRDQKTQQDLADFDNLMKTGDAALGSKNYAEAQNAFNNAQTKLPDEFGKRQGQKKLDQALQGLKTMDNAQRRTAEFNAARDVGLGAFNNKKWDDAIKQLEAARQTSPDDFKKQNLQAKLDDANRQKLAANAPAVVPTTVTAAADPAREGLRALFKGDAKGATALLEQALKAAKDKNVSATLHGYLGVAYATVALQSPDNSQPRKEFDDKARREFRTARSTDRKFKLNAQYVSKRVVDIFEKSGSDH